MSTVINDHNADAPATNPHSPLGRLLSKLGRVPKPLRNRLVQLGFGRFSPYFRFNKIRIVALEPDHVILGLANHARVRNHLGGIHAVAITLAAEYASGLLVGQHVPDSAVVVVKSIHIDLHTRIRGAIEARAALTADTLTAMREQPKGEAAVPVTVTDESGGQPISGRMQMAWFPKARQRE